VSVDLAVWEGPEPAGDDEAGATFADLLERFLDAPPAPPSERIAEYVSVLLARYPDLSDEGDDPVPWGSGPLMRNASGPILYVDMKLNDVVEEAWRFCVETAQAHGLVAFDPQSAALANPDPTAPSAKWVPDDERRGGAAYRWIALRSWRWPFLRPLLPLLRRFF
jgi:hypothetical protein